MSVTLGSFPYPNAAGYGGTVTLRVWYTGCTGLQFIEVGGDAIACGSAEGNFYVDIPCTLSASIITIPSTVLPTTDDSQTASVLASAQFFDNGAARDFLFTDWIITSTLGAAITFDQLYIYNLQVTPAFTLNPAYLTSPQIAALIAAAAGVLAKASTSPTYGITALSVTPASAANPVAYGANDPAVATLTGAQILTNKTLTTPTVASFTNAQHSHANAAGGGQIGTSGLGGDITAAGRAILDDANAAAQLVTLGLTATAAEINKLGGAGAIVASGTQHAHIADVANNATGTQLATAINAIIDALEAFGIALP